MRPNDVVMSELKDFAAWSQTGVQPGAITLIDYVGFVATPDLLFGFASLFSPDLVVHEGLRFLASGFSVKTYEQWVTQGTAPKEIQRVMNHLHISTLLQQGASDAVATETARTIAAIWSRTLGPEGLIAESLGSGIEDAAVTFFEA